MTLNRIIVIDSETTGVDPDNDAVLEVGWATLELVPDEGGLRDEWRLVGPGGYDWSYVAFEGDIPPEARAVHHIAPDDVRLGGDRVCERHVLFHELLAAEQPGEMIYAAHNAKFDSAMMRELTLPWLCTLRLARHLYPSAPSHKNQVLRYWLGVEPPAEMLAGLLPHRAMYDAAVTAALLAHVLNDKALSAEEAVALSRTPIVMESLPFGKHRGEPIADVPRSYLNWMLRSGNWKDDVDVMATIRAHI